MIVCCTTDSFTRAQRRPISQKLSRQRICLRRTTPQVAPAGAPAVESVGGARVTGRSRIWEGVKGMEVAIGIQGQSAGRKSVGQVHQKLAIFCKLYYSDVI